MKKVAIVGVEGSGKTVMLAGLGELYSHPDEKGYFLMPKNFSTSAYVQDKIARMRGGAWPSATAEDALQGLDWTLKRKQQGGRPETVCEVSCLDFAGEVYRAAFGIRSEDGTVASDEVQALKNYIRETDDLIVLINLKDVISRGVGNPRVQEAMWITNSILSVAFDESDGHKPPRAMIALSQADSYAETIKACGGAKGVLAKYLPHVANNYDWLDVVAVSAVDRTVVDDEGNVVPAPDFQPSGLRPIVDWMVCGLDARPLHQTTPRSPGRKLVLKRESVPPKKCEIPVPVLDERNLLACYFGCFARYSQFTGRASRKEFWGFFLFNFLAAGVLSAVNKEGVFFGLYALAAIIPGMAVFVRRLHDTNRSGRWWALCIIPYVGWVVVLIFLCLRGTPGDNDYGPDPQTL